MYHVYVLENLNGRLYIGHTDNLERRLNQHNSPEDKSHLGKYTHKNGPWILIGLEPYPTRSEAMRREKHLKSLKSPNKVRTHFQVAQR